MFASDVAFLLSHLMQHLMFWLWKANTGKGTTWGWWVTTLGEGYWNNIVELSCQTIKMQTRNRVDNPTEMLRITLHSASSSFYAVILFSRICFCCIKKGVWSLWHMRTLVEFLILSDLLKCFGFFSAQCNSWIEKEPRGVALSLTFMNKSCAGASFSWRWSSLETICSQSSVYCTCDTESPIAHRKC